MSGDRTANRIVGGGVYCWCAAAGIALGVTIAVVAAGASDDARRFLRFGFGGVERSPAEAASIALHNTRFVAGIVLAAAVVPRLGARGRAFLDAAMAGLLVVNAGAVGVAMGAYGTRAVAALAPHLPIEFGALSLAGGAYRQARSEPIGSMVLAGVAALCALLLAVAATLETYVSAGAGR